MYASPMSHRLRLRSRWTE